MAQCESKVFFPDDPAQPPQFTDSKTGGDHAPHFEADGTRRGYIHSEIVRRVREDVGRTRQRTQWRLDGIQTHRTHLAPAAFALVKSKDH